MKFRNCFVLVLFLIQVFSVCASADVIERTFEHNLGMTQGATSWEHRIDLPEELVAKGFVFHKRSFALTGRLVVESEELARTFYYVKVRLPKAQLLPMKGAIKVSLESTQAPVPPVIPAAPEKLYMTNPPEAPGFGWKGTGSYSNITLLDRHSGKTVWERVLVGANHCHLDEDKLYMHGRYIWAVRQSGEGAAWGPATEFRFRIESRIEICPNCHGISTQPPCQTCHGTGHVTVPVIYLDN